MSDSQRGRTRSESTRQAILEATRDELAASGYDKLSIDRIATAAGAGKQTVYRWYRSKNELVAECILEGYVPARTAVVADSGEVRGDLRAWLRGFADFLARTENASLIRACTAAAAESDEVAAKFYERVTAANEAALTARLDGAVRLGQLRADTSTAAVAEALIGAMLYRLLVRQAWTDEFINGLLGTVFNGIDVSSAPGSGR
ncbi:TetR/AcrR family transcriptional regulator [Streptomyces prunicolor]|uniref:TetR/AcrR family transcriptional regulator n=1 Tax=Streptomyces prunicolor TaxID=67348 RepID=UPI00047681FB|nr:TetR/AcrR family transcriptional regulator [Streptomyces prunicolor]